VLPGPDVGDDLLGDLPAGRQVLPSARSRAKTSCSQSLRKGSIASLGSGRNAPSACAWPHADRSGRNTPSLTRAWMCGCQG
jgi:hypothetical protein